LDFQFGGAAAVLVAVLRLGSRTIQTGGAVAQSIGIWTIGAVFVVITIVAFSWVVRALLGVQFTWTRLIIAGLISYFCFSPIMNGIVEPGDFEEGDIFPEFWFVLLGVMLALICGMVFLVIAEALIPSNTLPGPRYLVQSARQSWSRAGRYWQIVRILFRQGLISYLGGGRRREMRTPEGREQLAQRLRLALSEGGVTFVKVGQILSTRPTCSRRVHLRTLPSPVPGTNPAVVRDRTNAAGRSGEFSGPICLRRSPAAGGRLDCPGSLRQLVTVRRS
jgi:hypothetical protein